MSTASLGLVGSYQDFDIKRLHLVTPYIKEMNDAIIREYEKLGLTAAGVTGLGITENTEIGRRNSWRPCAAAQAQAMARGLQLSVRTWLLPGERT